LVLRHKNFLFLSFLQKAIYFSFFFLEKNNSLSVEEKKNVVSNSLKMRMKPEKKFSFSFVEQ